MSRIHLFFRAAAQGLLVFVAWFALTPLVSAQQTETPETPNFCVYRCLAAEPSPTDSEEYARWKSRAMNVLECRTGDACAQQCVTDCAARSGTTTGRRQTQRGTGTTATPEFVGGCERTNPPGNAAVSPQCSESAQPRVQGATAGVCIFKCPGVPSWSSGFLPQSCTAESCSSLCAAACGAPCGVNTSSCQPIPGQGNAVFQPPTEGAVTPPAAREGTVLPYGLRDPLGGTTPQRFIAGLIAYVLGFIGAIFLGMFIWAGLMWMTAGGETDKVKSAKSTIVNATIGMFIIALSYTLVSLIIQLPSLLAP